MKKLLGSTLALAMLLPAGADAELLKNLKVGGDILVDAVSVNNVTDGNTAKYDKVSNTQTRLMLKTDWDLLDDVHSHVTIDKNNRSYGQGSESVQKVQDSADLDEAYFKIDKLFGGLDTTVGRQFYGDAGDLVIYYGPRDTFTLPVTALDAVRADWNGENMGLTLLGSKVSKFSAQTTAGSPNADSGDTNLWGADFHMKPMDGASANAYLYRREIVTIAAGALPPISPDTLYVVGVKGKWTMGGAWIKAELAKNFGQATNYGGTPITQPSLSFPNTIGKYTGTALLANGGYKTDVGGVGTLTAWGEFGLGSGGLTSNRNFQGIAGDYRPGTIWGRFAAQGMSVIPPGNSISGNDSLSDLQTLGFGGKITPAALSKLTAAVSVWNFRLQNIQAANAIAKAPPYSDVNGASSKFLGNEYDLDLTWAHSENVAVSAGVADWQNGGFLKGLAADKGFAAKPITMAYADFHVKF